MGATVEFARPQSGLFPETPCVCVGEQVMCECSAGERALQHHALDTAVARAGGPLSSVQRAFCAEEVGRLAPGRFPADTLAEMNDRTLALAVLCVWRSPPSSP